MDAARKELGPEVLVIDSDASDAAAQKQVAEAVHQAFGGLDVLLVKVGIVDMRPMEQFDVDAFDRSFNINLKGPYFFIQALLPMFAIGVDVSMARSTSTLACPTQLFMRPRRLLCCPSSAPFQES